MRMFRLAVLPAALLAALTISPVSAQTTTEGKKKDAAAHATTDAAAKGQNAKAMQAKIKESLGELPAEERKLAQEQRFCAVMPHMRLGAMGKPVAVTLEGEKVLLCCEACVDTAKNHADKIVENAESLKEANKALAELPPAERRAAEAQKYCAVMSDNLLGSMGAPIKVELEGKPVYLCCEGCVKKAEANPKETLKKANALKKAGREAVQDHAGSDDHRQE